MATCTFTNLTAQQAKTLASWYDGQGEQDADTWFEAQGVEPPYTKNYKVLEDGNVVVNCHTFDEETGTFI